jgi:AraC-like DNA-binding protein
MTGQVHSVPVVAQRSACVLRTRAAHPRLHGQILGYCLSRSGSGEPLAHRLLPLAAVVLVADLDTGVATITGPRGAATTHGHTTWGRGLTVGFTPAGAGALLGVPMRELAGLNVPLSDVLGRARAAELAEAGRFDLLDELFSRWQRESPAASAAGEAWRRLQLADRQPTGALAGELGVGRRRLEREFRREIGLSPGAVARIARFQRAVQQLAGGVPLARAAVASGYADQPHLSRETRAMTGLTPAELRAIVQDAAPAAA